MNVGERTRGARELPQKKIERERKTSGLIGQKREAGGMREKAFLSVHMRGAALPAVIKGLLRIRVRACVRVRVHFNFNVHVHVSGHSQ